MLTSHDRLRAAFSDDDRANRVDRRAGHVLLAGLAVIGRWLANWQERRELRRLYSFSDRELSDIGLLRSDLYTALEGPLARSPSKELSMAAESRRLSDLAARKSLKSLRARAVWPSPRGRRAA